MYCNVCNCNLCDLHPRHTSSADCLVINNKNKDKNKDLWQMSHANRTTKTSSVETLIAKALALVILRL